MIPTEKEPEMLSRLGLRATYIYLIILFGGIPIAGFFGLIDFSPIKLNELGDFLAGAFGPLAIFWLILGFFQQGKELRNSVETLRLQTEELNQSVQQQKALVEISEKQHTFELEERRIRTATETEKSLPNFIVAGAGSYSSTVKNDRGICQIRNSFKLRNRGADAKYLTLKTSLNGNPPEKHMDIPSGAQIEIDIFDPKFAKDWDFATLTIVSTSVHDKTKTQEFLISNPAIPETTEKKSIDARDPVPGRARPPPRGGRISCPLDAIASLRPHLIHRIKCKTASSPRSGAALMLELGPTPVRHFARYTN